jgi:polygalacturonase
MGNPLNVLDFGAVGDGATNNLTAFTNAINAANAGNSLVYVPEGDYRIWGGNLPAFTTSRGRTATARRALD